MNDFTIDSFWKRRLSVRSLSHPPSIPGWSIEQGGLSTFREAPLTLSAELSTDNEPNQSPVVLVSAPGAVGKSTLAKQIAFETGAIYVDLAKAEPVGGNSISGGLFRSRFHVEWVEEKTTLLIDGLDEARLRVTHEAFEAFLGDIAEITKDRTIPIVIFGRTGAIQDAWVVLNENRAKAAILEIGFYDLEKSIEFAEARISARNAVRPHAAVERQAIELILRKLRSQTGQDGDRFAGYAPVLQAVAERVEKETNPSALIAQINKGDQPVTLRSVARSILEREREKLKSIGFEDAAVAATLYSTNEQLDRLVSHVYGLPTPPLPQMNPKDAQVYSTALETWVPEHPFLDGGQQASSAVFEAIIAIHALRDARSAAVALQKELRRGTAANPFLAEFYVSDNEGETLSLPPEHIGIVYSSLRAGLSLGDAASLSIDSDDDAEEEALLRADGEIAVVRRDAERPMVLKFNTEQAGLLRLGSYVEDVDINLPSAHLEIGPSSEVLLVAPVNIQVGMLSVSSEKIVIEGAPGSDDYGVYLEANEFVGDRVVNVPVLRGNTSFAVVWPNARAHPWTNFATDPTPIADPRLGEALRRFRKFVTAFRSHSKGSLARYRDKIDHSRMTKGTGQAVLNNLLDRKVIVLSGNMYFLDADRLGDLTGASYIDCVFRRFSPETMTYWDQVLSAMPEQKYSRTGLKGGTTNVFPR